MINVAISAAGVIAGTRVDLRPNGPASTDVGVCEDEFLRPGNDGGEVELAAWRGPYHGIRPAAHGVDTDVEHNLSRSPCGLVADNLTPLVDTIHCVFRGGQSCEAR